MTSQLDLFMSASPTPHPAPQPVVRPSVAAKPPPPPPTPAKRKKPHVAPPAPKTTGYDIVEARKTPPVSCAGCGRHYNTYEEAYAHVATCRDAAKWRRKNGTE